MVFATPASAAGPVGEAPTISGELVSGVTEHSARFEAQIDPSGLETTYEISFEIGCPIEPVGASCALIITRPIGHGEIAAGAGTQTISVELTLEPGYRNNYWVGIVARNSAGEASGRSATFHTPPKGSEGPAIEAESSSHVSATDATLEATINPQDAERGVHYQFQVVSHSSEYLTEFACPPEWAHTSLCDLGRLNTTAEGLPIDDTTAGVGGQEVSLDLGKAGVTLKPSTTYHYRVITARIVPSEDGFDWEGPLVIGADQTFTTPPATETLVTEPTPVSTGQTAVPPSSQSTASDDGPHSAPAGAPLVSPLGERVDHKVLAGSRKLARALRECAKRPKKQRASCRKQAHTKYTTIVMKADARGAKS
jgi:hypothetical protein